MKRLSTYLTLLVMAALPFTFTSCEEDWYDGYDWYDKPYYDATDYALDLAQTLSGTWEGTIINEYYNEDGEREQTKCDADFTFVQYRSDAINGTDTRPTTMVRATSRRCASSGMSTIARAM